MRKCLVTTFCLFYLLVLILVSFHIYICFVVLCTSAAMATQFPSGIYKVSLVGHQMAIAVTACEWKSTEKTAFALDLCKHFPAQCMSSVTCFWSIKKRMSIYCTTV